MPDPATVSNDSLPAATSSDTVFDLLAFDLPLNVAAPDEQAAEGVALAVRWNEERGWAEVDRGPHFQLRISEALGDDINRLKADLERDPLRKHTILSEAPDQLVYRQQFPDDPTLVFVHFLRIVPVGDRSFAVESAPDGRFNEADVVRMAAAVAPATASSGA